MKMLIIMIAGICAYAQTDELKGIEFTSVARGYQESLKITKDSITHKIERHGDSPINKSYPIKEADWNCIVSEVNKINRREISELQSPTMKRAYDGARHSSIIITMKDGAEFTHSFDDEEPHKKLTALMKGIEKWRKKAKL
jgi:hypothetical protein